ncbi:D-alanyl-D-alanine carboxypeptidase [Anoxybacillus vitaminiphilus]|uniref:D-alanyl-D-alanine carboxypeptidase n=1 Tax=Paranoxybacillus vitaminiphilus TaxID=581036 RepID=A0A327YE39_9BACL|nr:M15 family metallopeptidase [Anoxybacillus vitaminiphilus]RAK18442.1 D-alanyl-D-alanine carboxypeptidase [Anoxybacillus vitaminiphilus]
MKRLFFLLIIACSILLSGCMPSYFQGQETNDTTYVNSETEREQKAPQTPKKAEQEPAIAPDLLLESQYWNVTEVQNGINVIMNPENILALVNKENNLPENYKPNDLVVPNVPFTFAEQNVEKRFMRTEAAKALEKMFSAAKQAGVYLIAASGYRSYERQKSLFEQEVEKAGKEKAIHAVALPGQSEHQTGLAMDITSPSVKNEITIAFGETKEGKWVAAHAHEFGFIIRYPKGKEQITGYQYEPWHIRYVGKKAAKVMFERRLTLEEYFQVVKKI